jgi:hypothetical protein
MTDWENREFVEKLRLEVNRLVQFLNELDRNTRAHASVLEQHLDEMERKLDQLEAAIDRTL